jgi:putative aminopeptidase FrvX
MRRQTLVSILRRILRTPTAPFHEYHMAATIRDCLAGLPHVSIEPDAFGNLIATYRRGRSKPRLAYCAHLDHPGWVKKPGGGADEREFLGGVPADRLDKCPVKWFGEFGMWDLPAFDLKDGIVHSRACDDLVGCAEIVALFHELERREAEVTCYGLFTRAEEVGFVGAIHLAKSWPLPDGVRFVSLETSAPRGGAVIGAGPVVRVGDRMSVFDDEIVAELLAAATEEKITVQRALLDGGSCEATAMQLYGIRSAGMSVLLGNYHNCTPEGGIDVEYVSLADVAALVELITATTIRLGSGSKGSPARAALKLRLEENLKKHAPHDRAARTAWEKAETGAVTPLGSGSAASPRRPKSKRPRQSRS